MHRDESDHKQRKGRWQMVNTVGVLHPGEMGAAIGGAAREIGAEVLWAPEDRSPATKERAEESGLEAASLPELLGRCEVVLSVCPPHAALSVAEEVASLGFHNIYVDANAVSPETTRAVSRVVEEGGARYVDGGIIGPPPREPGATTLCLSGADAQQVAQLFEGSTLGVRLLGDGAGTASALKMCYAAWTKGSMALLLTVQAAAEAHGLSDELFEQWDASQPGLRDKAEAAAREVRSKAWRWVAEMNEIEHTLETVGLPGGFHAAAAEIYTRMSAAEGLPEHAQTAQIVAALQADD
jgi:3-hydroxyisobutyrate dehydrogenase-like beta-hydroxyacid dehydrogenase